MLALLPAFLLAQGGHGTQAGHGPHGGHGPHSGDVATPPGVIRPPGSPKRPDKVLLTNAEWKKRLTPLQYKILRNQGTEAAFCSRLNDVKEKGTFYCVGCENPLFTTAAKFKSGTGWPSFFRPVSRDAVWKRPDRSHGMVRTEVLCSKCDGHLGHVFDDGPRDKTGLRYCMNGEILHFVPDGKKH